MYFVMLEGLKLMYVLRVETTFSLPFVCHKAVHVFHSVGGKVKPYILVAVCRAYGATGSIEMLLITKDILSPSDDRLK